tara:strand:+ start:3522 stop:4223 length:702 start_codon:yes stop_codon:yes gene_type:complete
MSNTLLLLIEGNITTGKGIFINGLQKTLSKISGKIYIHSHPAVGGKISEDLNIYDLFYLEPRRWAAEFIMHTLTSKLQFINTYCKEPNAILIMERSIQTESKVFIQSLYDCNIITRVTYLKCTDLIETIDQLCKQFFENATYIYLKTDPTDLYDSLMIHNVYPCINFKLLEKIHHNYETFLENVEDSNTNAYYISVDIPFDQIFKPHANTIKSAFKQLQKIYPIFQNTPTGSF